LNASVTTCLLNCSTSKRISSGACARLIDFSSPGVQQNESAIASSSVQCAALDQCVKSAFAHG
jgi:hypothetical protein